MGASKRSRSSASSFYTGPQLQFQKQALGALGEHVGQYGFGRAPYEGSMIEPYSMAQIGAARGLVAPFEASLSPVDYGALRAAANRNFQTNVERTLLPEFGEQAAVLGGRYSSDYTRNISDAISERALGLEQTLAGIEAASAEAAAGRAFAAPQYAEQLLFATDPEQFYRQALESARYAEFMGQNDPAYMAAIIGAIPNALQSTQTAKGHQPKSWQEYAGVLTELLKALPSE